MLLAPIANLLSLSSHIQGRVQISKDLHQRKLGDEPLKGQELIRSLHKVAIRLGIFVGNFYGLYNPGFCQCFYNDTQ